VRAIVVLCVCVASCAKAEAVQDPLDYLRIGVDPRAEAREVVRDLERHGYRIGRRIEEPRYVAFEASSGPDSTVRILTTRGPAFAIHSPDVRTPRRVRVGLASIDQPDSDGDGQRDVVVAIEEIDRTCFAWLEVDDSGFVSEVFRPESSWGEAACLLHIDPRGARLVLEVTVPGASGLGARVKVPIRTGTEGWTIDHSPSATDRWEHETRLRKLALDAAKSAGDVSAIERLETELGWIERLRAPRESDEGVASPEPVLEPTGDGEEAR
jgi:hypothetical protein